MNVNAFDLVLNTEMDQIIDPAAAAQTLVSNNGAPIFVGDCEAFAILVLMGTIAATGTVDVKLKHGDLSNGSDLADVAGSAMTQMLPADSNKILATGVIRPIKAYISPNITRAVANSDVRGVLLIKYGIRVRPGTHTAKVKASKSLGSPLSGVA